MKKTGVLNHQISRVIAEMGHMDQLTICDAGLPIPMGVERVDLAIRPGLPQFFDVVLTIAQELEVERVILAEELKQSNSELIRLLEQLFGDCKFEYVPHTVFKQKTTQSRAIIRTGECTPYANIILQSGVVF
jgi:D-ribose pyranase